MNSFFLGDAERFSPSMIGCSAKDFSLSYRPPDIYLAFFTSKTNHFPPPTVGPAARAALGFSPFKLDKCLDQCYVENPLSRQG